MHFYNLLVFGQNNNPALKTLRLALYYATKYFNSEIKHEQPEGHSSLS